MFKYNIGGGDSREKGSMECISHHALWALNPYLWGKFKAIN